MKTGCNYSGVLVRLLKEKLIDVDYIKKCAFDTDDEIFNELRGMRPVLLHGLGHFEYTGMKDMSVIDFERADRLIKICGSPHYATHMSISNADMHEGMTQEDIHIRMTDFIDIFKARIPVSLLLENSVDTSIERITYDRYPYALPEQMNRLLVENDVSLLLDLTHARLTAEYNGWDTHSYIKEFLLERVREIHICGSGFDGHGVPMDTHQALTDADYALLDWALSYARPEVVTLEYEGVNGENEEIVAAHLVEQLKRIKEICGNPR